MYIKKIYTVLFFYTLLKSIPEARNLKVTKEGLKVKLKREIQRLSTFAR